MVSTDTIIENLIYTLGNSSAVISKISPITGMGMAAGKCGVRSAKTFKSFMLGGFYSPSFYLNGASSLCSGLSFGLQVGSYVSRVSCPIVSLPLYAFSQLFSSCGDTIDNCFGFVSVVF